MQTDISVESSGPLPRRAIVWLALLFLFFTHSLLVPSPVAAQSAADYAVQLSAMVQTNPVQVTLSWQRDANATNYSVYRKPRDGTVWGTAIASLPGTATNHLDTSVSFGGSYEYRVAKAAVSPSTNYTADGYVYCGIRLNFTDSRGKVILIVDNSHAAALVVELARLERDLVGDGWIVARHDVARSASVASVASLIRADYAVDSSRVRAVFLFGHVPVPYSGNLNPDAHPDHRGAWPADVYYGDVDGLWPDSTVSTTSAASARNRNVPGDGKFDPSTIPSTIELQVGRVDLGSLPSFALSEVELLRAYLNKNHAYRHREFTVPARGLIDDQFGTFGGEAFAANGWRNFAALCGRENIVAADWLSTLPNNAYLLAYGCGGGTYTSADGVTTTADLAARDQRAVFTLLFGSYFGDWDTSDNLLRATLASSPYVLATGWAGRPNWHLHHMGMGETIGFSTRLTQNNAGLYSANYSARGVHVALLGDPTLRLHMVTPPSGLTIRTNPSGGLRLSWVASPDPVLGYHIFRASTPAGPFLRVTSNQALVTTNEYVDVNGAAQTYLVRALKLENTPSGSYLNLSQGVFQNAAGSFGPPTLAIEPGAPGAGGLLVSWPATMLGYHLESANSLLTPASEWTRVNVRLGTNAGRIVAPMPIGAREQFIRLREP